LEVEVDTRERNTGFQDERWPERRSWGNIQGGDKGSISMTECQTNGSNDHLQAALFPCGVSLAATWNKNILFSVGQHLADEAKARSAQVLLAPTVCLHRGPLGGRNFESFSEDPYLTGKLAASYINGLQGKGVAATIKRE
jgi:beta-glucosidase-like glycosyl hydrolase